jgi:hypothetical protein
VDFTKMIAAAQGTVGEVTYLNFFLG